MHKIFTLNSWDEFMKHVPEMFKNYIFRGHQNSNWKLESSYDRSNLKKVGVTEQSLLGSFRFTVSTLGLTNLPNSRLGWLALMQHQGVPTRLLDFSFSPFIAAYFAFEPCFTSFYYHNDPDEMVSIWAVNYLSLQHQFDLEHMSVLKDAAERAYESHYFNDDEYEVIMNNQNKFDTSCFLCSPILGNNRLVNQQGVFLSHNSNEQSLFQILTIAKYNNDNFSDLVYQINIPKSETYTALKYLFNMNIRPSILFPGLDGIAKEVSLKDLLKTSLLSSSFPQKLNKIKIPFELAERIKVVHQ
ncbi:MAG: FRG domain-containing protein [Sphingobacteriia bacterium]|nr:FRG domain-containing protein [Sphingobacteriia bacterium]